MRWSLQVVEIELFCRRQQCLGYILFETRPQGTIFGQLFYNISLMYSGMFFPPARPYSLQVPSPSPRQRASAPNARLR